MNEALYVFMALVGFAVTLRHRENTYRGLMHALHLRLESANSDLRKAQDELERVKAEINAIINRK